MCRDIAWRCVNLRPWPTDRYCDNSVVRECKRRGVEDGKKGGRFGRKGREFLGVALSREDGFVSTILSSPPFSSHAPVAPSLSIKYRVCENAIFLASIHVFVVFISLCVFILRCEAKRGEDLLSCFYLGKVKNPRGGFYPKAPAFAKSSNIFQIGSFKSVFLLGPTSTLPFRSSCPYPSTPDNLPLSSRLSSSFEIKLGNFDIIFRGGPESSTSGAACTLLSTSSNLRQIHHLDFYDFVHADSARGIPPLPSFLSS